MVIMYYVLSVRYTFIYFNGLMLYAAGVTESHVQDCMLHKHEQTI